MAKVTFARVPGTNNLVPEIDINPSINLISEPMAPPNPYATGYGNRIPTRYKVRVFDQRFRRVYITLHSNVGTAYIVYRGKAYRVGW